MSCCNNGPRRVNYIINCNPDCPDVQDWVFSNANVEGQGVFFQQDGTSVEFYGLMNTDGYLTVTLDAVNKAISIDLDPALIAGSIPDATTTVKGKVELATDAEAQAKTDTAKALTPSNLATITASTTATGLVELATSPETVTGTDTQRATTPAGVKAALDATKAIQVVADATARGSATPLYVGQQLYQTDTKATYTGTSLAAGGWEGPVIRGGATNVIGDTTVNVGTNQLIFAGSTGGYVTFMTPTKVVFQCSVDFDILDCRFRLSDTLIPAMSVLGTGSIAGEPASYLISDFLSLHNLSPAYAPINYIGTRAFDADTVTHEQLADVVATLIADLSVLQLPNIT